MIEMQKYIKLAINGGQTLPRCQHERSKQRGGGQCMQSAQEGRIYCPNHPTREIAKREMNTRMVDLAIFDDSFKIEMRAPTKQKRVIYVNDAKRITKLKKDIPAQVSAINRWEAIVLQFLKQTSKTTKFWRR